MKVFDITSYELQTLGWNFQSNYHGLLINFGNNQCEVKVSIPWTSILELYLL